MQLTTAQDPNAELAIRYHEAIAAFAAGDALTSILAPEMLHRELPNLLLPHGVVRDIPAILNTSARGRAPVREQTYEVLNIVSNDDKVALELLWSGVLGKPVGHMPAGRVLRAHIGAFLDMRDGKICGQRSYDCYEPLST